MENNTTTSVSNYTSGPPMTQQTLWIVSQALNSFLMAISIWVTITVGVYGCKTGMFTRKKLLDYSGGMILKTAFAATFLVIPRLVANQVVILIGFHNNSGEADFECEVAQDVAIGIYYVSLFPVYLFLWVRQRSLYQQPSIKRLYNKFIMFLGWSCLVFLIIAGIGIVGLFVWPLTYMASSQGCVLRQEEKDNFDGFYVLVFVLLTGQFTLLGLFIYPLHRHRHIHVAVAYTRKDSSQLQMTSITSFSTVKDGETMESQEIVKHKEDNPYPQHCYTMTNSNTNYQASLDNFRCKSTLAESGKIKASVPSASKKRRGSVRTANRVIRVMYRSVACAVVCIVSDVAAMLVSGFLLPKEYPKGLTNNVFDISLMVNVISVIMSFEQYKKIFSAFCTIRKKSSQSQIISAVTRSTNDYSNSK